MEKLLTLKEVCTILRHTEDPKGRFVRELRKKGLIEGAKIGNRLLFKESSVQRYIDSQFDMQNKKACLRHAPV